MDSSNQAIAADPIYRPAADRRYQRPEFTSLPQLLARRAHHNPGAVAVLAPGLQPLTYEQLWQQAEQTIRGIRKRGLGRNDRIAMVLPNGSQMAVAFLAVGCAASCAPLNPAYRADEFDFYLTDLKARAVIVEAGSDSAVRDVARLRGIPVIELVRDARKGSAGFELVGGEGGQENYDSPATPDDVALVLHTSGTTSRPKIVPLTQANICTSAHNVAVSLFLTAADRCLAIMPLFHIHGLIASVLAPVTAGGSVACPEGFDSEKFFEWLDAFAPTWYTAVPTIHQAIVSRASAHAEAVGRRRLRFIRSSSASLPPRLMADLGRIFKTTVVEAYGMTEASHQVASNPLDGEQKPGSVGLAAGPDIAIMDENGNLLPEGASGEIVIRGNNVTSGYENNPAANAGAFVQGWFRTGDLGSFDSDGYLYLTGRSKEIINRGGEKIAPREVEDVLTQHDAVAQAAAFAIPHPTLGEEVAAAVVLRRESQATESEIREFVAARLAAFKAPKQLLILDQIPKGPTGKVQRIGLADKLAKELAAKRESGFVAGSDPVEIELAGIWKRLLKVERVGVHDEFHALGGDSLAMTVMLNEVEERFHTRIPVDQFLRRPTVSTLALAIQGKPTEAAVQEEPAVKDSFLRGMKNRLLQLIALYAPGYKSTRVWLNRMRGVTIGTNTSIGLSALIESAYPSLVSIGDNVTIGTRAIIIGHLRDFTDSARSGNRKTVRIEDEVYLGPGAIVLPNVTIGKGAVVSAGSVVTRSVPPRTLVQGNPAKPVARCGVSLGGGVSYEQFIRHLTPIDGQSSEPGAEPR